MPSTPTVKEISKSCALCVNVKRNSRGVTAKGYFVLPQLQDLVTEAWHGGHGPGWHRLEQESGLKHTLHNDIQIDITPR